MVGRVYRWDGRLWIVRARWRPGELRDATHVCNACGAIDPPFGFFGEHGGCGVCRRSGRLPSVLRGRMSAKVGHYVETQFVGYCPRNVLLERVDEHVQDQTGDPVYVPMGEFTVRPFRGLRCV